LAEYLPPRATKVLNISYLFAILTMGAKFGWIQELAVLSGLIMESILGRWGILNNSAIRIG
jgi:hypothetical protein